MAVKYLKKNKPWYHKISSSRKKNSLFAIVSDVTDNCMVWNGLKNWRQMVCIAGVYACLWESCGFESSDSSEIMRHVNYHSYHTKIKCIGSNILARTKLPVSDKVTGVWCVDVVQVYWCLLVLMLNPLVLNITNWQHTVWCLKCWTLLIGNG